MQNLGLSKNTFRRQSSWTLSSSNWNSSSLILSIFNDCDIYL